MFMQQQIFLYDISGFYLTALFVCPQVLATDMSQHFEVLENATRMVHHFMKPSSASSNNTFRNLNFSQLELKYQTLVLQICIKVRLFSQVKLTGKPVTLLQSWERLIWCPVVRKGVNQVVKLQLYMTDESFKKQRASENTA